MSILDLNDNLSVFPSPKKKGSLISKGIYGYVRHPIYLGVIISMTAFAVFSVSPIKFMITGIMIMVLYLKSKFEEKKLVMHFSEYKKYKDRTGRFFPKKL
jgi:protein-S-isoprenylcysteine O-methyltransferase Ste14